MTGKQREIAYSLLAQIKIHKIMGVKWNTKLTANNLLVSNDADASFAAEAYILTV